MAAVEGTDTNPVIEKSSILWILDDFIHLQGKRDVAGSRCYWVNSAPFSAAGGHCRWTLKLNLCNVHGRNNNNCMAVGLQLSEGSPQYIQTSGKFTLSNSSDTPLFTHSWTIEDFCQYRAYVQIAELEKSALFAEIKDNVLKIRAEITAFLPRWSVPANFRPLQSTVVEDEKSREHLSKAMLALLKSTARSDFVIRVRGTDIPVHKYILALRSTFFDDKLKSETPENQLGLMEVDDLELETARAMIDFIYTGHVKQQNVLSAQTLLKAAYLYGVGDLMKECSVYLRSHLCSSNVFETLQYAYSAKASELRDACIFFVFQNKGVIVVDDERKKRLGVQQDNPIIMIAEIYANMRTRI